MSTSVWGSAPSLIQLPTVSRTPDVVGDMSIYAGGQCLVVDVRGFRPSTIRGLQAPRVIIYYPTPGDWWCRQDSNLWPSVPQTDVLSPELRHHQSSCGNSSNCRGSFWARRWISASSSATILSMIASMSFNCRINSRGVCRGNIDLASLTSSQRPP